MSVKHIIDIRASSWNTDRIDTRSMRAMPSDIPTHLARLMVSYARVIVRMPPEQAMLAVRALEAMIEDGKQSDVR